MCGHHAITASAWDVLIENFELTAKWIHDLTVDKFAGGVVYSNGKGVDMNMDHHKAQNYGTLWTQLDFGKLIDSCEPHSHNINLTVMAAVSCCAFAGKSNRVLNSGGRQGRGLDAGALTTFWNLQGDKQFKCKSDLTTSFGPFVNFVAVPEDMPFPSMNTTLTRSWRVWRGQLPRDGHGGRIPTNLYESMKALRLGSPNMVSRRLGGAGVGGKRLSEY
jgi:hypothetical protein